jgi:hypothetical protein
MQENNWMAGLGGSPSGYGGGKGNWNISGVLRMWEYAGRTERVVR